MAGGIIVVNEAWEFPVLNYMSGASLTEVAEDYGVPISSLRYHVKKAGVLRTRTEGIRKAADRGRLGSGMRGKTRVFSDAHKAAISEGKIAAADNYAVGTSLKSSGYVEYTRGENKGRSVHVVAMEERLGRHLLPDEIVHHIDGNRQNNDDNNLSLMTRSAHTRLHRREEKLAKGNI